MTSQNFLMHFRAQFPWVSQRPVVALDPIFYGFLTITPPNYGGTTGIYISVGKRKRPRPENLVTGLGHGPINA